MSKEESRNRLIVVAVFLGVAVPLWSIGWGGAVPVGLLVMVVVGSYLTRCRHPEADRRCIHGEEIMYRGGRRALCTLCGAAKKSWSLPEICSETLKPHS